MLIDQWKFEVRPEARSRYEQDNQAFIRAFRRTMKEFDNIEDNLEKKKLTPMLEEAHDNQTNGGGGGDVELGTTTKNTAD